MPSIHYCFLSSLLQIVVLNAWQLGPGCHDFRSELIMFSWIYLCSWSYLQFVCTYYTPKPATSRWQVGVSMGKDDGLRSSCIHGVLMLWSGALWEEYLNCQKFLKWSRSNGLVGQKMLCKFLFQACTTTSGCMSNVWFTLGFVFLISEPFPVN